MPSESLQRRIDDARVEGWQVHERQGDRVIMVNRDLGTLVGHVLIFVLFGWWTLGFANVLYAAYRYFFQSDKRVIRADEEAE